MSGLYGRRVRRSATLGAWSRRQTVLAGCLAATAALAGLPVPFGVPWLADFEAGQPPSPDDPDEYQRNLERRP